MKRLIIAAGLAALLAYVILQVNITTHDAWSGSWSLTLYNVSGGSIVSPNIGQNGWIGYNPATNGTFKPLIVPNIYQVYLTTLTGSLALYINATQCYSLNGGAVQMWVGTKTFAFPPSSPLNYTIQYSDPYISITVKPITSSYYYIVLQAPPGGYSSSNAPSGFWIECNNGTTVNAPALPGITLIIK